MHPGRFRQRNAAIAWLGCGFALAISSGRAAQNLRSLLPPPHRKSPHPPVQLQPRRLSSFEDRLDNVRRQQRQPQHAADIGLVDLLGSGRFGDGDRLAPGFAAGAGSSPFRVAARIPIAWLRACSQVRTVLGPRLMRRDRRPARYWTMYRLRPLGRGRRWSDQTRHRRDQTPNPNGGDPDGGP